MDDSIFVHIQEKQSSIVHTQEDRLVIAMGAVGPAGPAGLDGSAGPVEESGVFTPVVIGQAPAGVGTYLAQQGVYVKIGSLVFVSINLSWMAHTGAGEMRIAGLPFSANAYNHALSIGLSSNIPLASGHILTALVMAGAPTVALYSYPSGGGALAIPNVATSFAQLMLSGTYLVA